MKKKSIFIFSSLVGLLLVSCASKASFQPVTKTPPVKSFQLLEKVSSGEGIVRNRFTVDAGEYSIYKQDEGGFYYKSKTGNVNERELLIFSLTTSGGLYWENGAEKPTHIYSKKQLTGYSKNRVNSDKIVIKKN